MKFLNNHKVKRRLSIPRQKRKIKRLSGFFTPILTLAVFSLALYTVFFKFEYFNINNAVVEGTKSFVNDLDMLELVKTRSYGSNILFFDTQTLEDSLTKDFQGAKTITVNKKYPRTLVIEVTERSPLAIVNNEKDPEHFLVDDDGYVLGIVAPETSNFPKIFYNGNIAVGYFLDKDAIEMYFKVISATDETNIVIKTVSIFDNYLVMITGDNVEVLLGKNKDMGSSVKALAALLQQLKAESKDVAKVDLRYDKVIVSYR